MRIAIAAILVLVLASAALAADRTVTVTPVTGPVQNINPSDAAGVCVYGNNSAPAYAITDWIWGAESYATVFRAAQPTCTACGVGFTIEQVHFFMNFSVADVPATFNARVSFSETDDAGCAVPTAEICASPVYQVTITTAGLYNIGLPLDPAACSCAFFDYDYAVAIDFPDLFPATMRPDGVTDNAPLGCVTYNDYGSGWTDLQTVGFPGEMIMYADVVCCEPAVPGEAQSWGGLKSTYR